MKDFTMQKFVTITETEPGLEHILFHNTELAIILRAGYRVSGIRFFTPNSFSQQLGYMNHPQGHTIAPHDHNPIPRTVEWTQETLFIRSGKVRLDLFAPDSRVYLGSWELATGDIVLLAHGGHGLSILEDSEIIEVKQGPYAGEADKTRFLPVSSEQVHVPGELL